MTRLHVIVLAAAYLSISGLSACTTRPADDPSSRIEVSAPPNFSIRWVHVRSAAGAAYYHGLICRRVAGPMPPTRIRAELVGPAEAIVQVAFGYLDMIGRHPGGCGSFAVRANWPARSGERVRICATNSESACAVGASVQ